MKPFLGRTVFDDRTMMYHCKDGSGAVPVEMKYDLECEAERVAPLGANGIYVLGMLFAWKDRLAKVPK